MKNAICKHCINLCKRTYVADCDNYKVEEISKLIAEKNKLQVSQSDPVRLKYLIDRIDYFFYGIC